MKTENEDGSIMKSTIRYSFVAPGAIGRGRGRWLKSLTSKGKFPAKSLVFQSSDLVKQYIQEVETGSSNPRKVKRVRGSNKCKEVASLEAGKRLKVTFYNNRTVGTNSNLFSRHLGKVIRDCNMCPLGVSSWSDIKQQKLDHMWAAITDKFESVDLNDHRDHIFGWMNELWNKWRGYLHATYVKNKPIVQALKNIPKGIEQKERVWLVKEHFCSESFQAQIEEILKVEPSLPSIEIVEKCCEPQTRSHVFGFGGGVKAKDMRGGTSLKTELLSQLCSTQEENKSLNEKNKSLNDRLSTLEDEMKEIRKMQEFFAAQQLHNLHMTSPVSTE
uniref:Transposon protein, CACTA, En/Spm sub-class n=1 Tax=Solanum tuberosum TaxID=4113 RepID=M1E037_SOLTU